MRLQKSLTFLMLVALGITGVAAAVVAIRSGDEHGWRLIETGVDCSLATALLLPFATRADRNASRLDGLAGMIVVILLFATSLGLTWGFFEALGGGELEEKVWWSMFYVGAVGLPLAMKMRLLSSPAHRPAGIVGLSLSAIVLPLLLLGIWLHDADRRWRHESSGVILSGTGLLAMLALFGVGQRPRRHWRWVGVLAATTAASLWLMDVWIAGVRYGDWSEWIRVSAICLAGAVAHLVICILIPLTRGQRWIRPLTVLAAFATAGSVAASAWSVDHGHPWDDVLQRTTDAAGILTCCGTLTLLVLARMNRGLDRRPVLSEIAEITIVCPGCRSQETVSVGDSACVSCGLKFNIRVDEPRCPQCDYLLYMLTTPRCPECGCDVSARRALA